jgi:hypothetical protein
VAELKLSEAMEGMLVDALVFGGAMLTGVTQKALRVRDLSTPADSAGDRHLTPYGKNLARRFALEDAQTGVLTVQILRDLASVTGMQLTTDGLALIEVMDDLAASAAERAAERGPGCGLSCGC